MIVQQDSLLVLRFVFIRDWVQQIKSQDRPPCHLAAAGCLPLG